MSTVLETKGAFIVKVIDVKRGKFIDKARDKTDE